MIIRLLEASEEKKEKVVHKLTKDLKPKEVVETPEEEVSDESLGFMSPKKSRKKAE